MAFYKHFIKPLLFLLPPETAHEVIKGLSPLMTHSWVKNLLEFRHPCLITKIGQSEIANPIGLAAGFDKNATLMNLIQSLGFGFSEIGSVTLHPCSGQKKPRVFRLPKDTALINRMGLPNDGATAILPRLQNNFCPRGVNIALTPSFVKNDKNRNDLDEWYQIFNKLHGYGFYTVLNLSCPNSGDTKTFQDLELAKSLFCAIEFARKTLRHNPPVLIKISPDLDLNKLKLLVELTLNCGLNGFILGNTSTTRQNLNTHQNMLNQIGGGGLSGEPLAEMVNAQIEKTREVSGPQPIIIGVGGVMTSDDVLLKMALGANLVQVYTGLIYSGPTLVKQILKALVLACEQCDVAHASELTKNLKLKKLLQQKKHGF